MISFPTPPSPTPASIHHTNESTVPPPRRPIIAKRHQSYSPDLSSNGVAQQHLAQNGIRPRLKSEGRAESYGPRRYSRQSMGYTRTIPVAHKEKDMDREKETTSPPELYAFPSFSSQAQSRSAQLYDSIEGRLMSGSGASTPNSTKPRQSQKHGNQSTNAAARERERLEREREKIQRYRAGGSPRYDDGRDLLLQPHRSLHSTINSTTSSRSEGTDEFGVPGMSAVGPGAGQLNSPSGSAFSTRSFGSQAMALSMTNSATPTGISTRSPGDPSGDELHDYPASPLLTRHRTRKSIDTGTALVTESNRLRDREIEKGVRITTGGMSKKKSGFLRGKGGGLRVEGEMRRGSEEQTLEAKIVLLGSQGEPRRFETSSDRGRRANPFCFTQGSANRRWRGGMRKDYSRRKRHGPR